MGGTGRAPEPFLDWYAIWPGGTGYEADGRAWVSDAPRGVCLAVQHPEEKAELLLVSDQPWEGESVDVVSVLQEGGRFRVWYNTTPPGWTTQALCYAESEDTLHWVKPALGLSEFEGSKENNIILPGLNGQVFRDTNPSAPDAEHYKLIHKVGRWVRQGKPIDEPHALRLRQELSAKGYSEAQINAEVALEADVLGAVSPDGLRWTAIAEPLLRMFCDCDNIVYYDPDAGRYVGFFRHNMFRKEIPVYWPPNPRRCVGRAETEDFRHWPKPRIVLQPDSQDPPTDDMYTNGYSPYPGAPYHVMFSSIYHRVQDVVDVHLAVSRDGYNWTRPQRTPILPLGAEGSGEDGMLYAKHGLFPLDESRWGLIYRATSARHNEGYYYESHEECYHQRWAIWKRDRLVALQAPVEGQVTLMPRECRGERLLLNYQAESNGWVRAELIVPEIWPPIHLEAIKGHGFADCEALCGDSLEQEVRWNGSADLSALKGRSVCVRISMCKAKLFSLYI